MGFLNTLLGLVGGGTGSAISSFLSYLFQLVINVFKFLLTLVRLFLDYVLKVFKNIGSFFSHLWDNFFKKIFVGMFHAFQKLHDWLEDHLGPIIKWLQKAQKYILSIYNKYVKPFLVLIQHVRQFLVILRALNIKWAQQLDHILSTIQNDINAAFLKVYATLNLTIDLLNIITDPEKLLRHPVQLLSIRRVFLALVRQLTSLPPGYFFPSRKGHTPKGAGPVTSKMFSTDPSYIQPPSFYLSADTSIPSLAGWDALTPVPDSFGDDVAPLGFFAIDNTPISSCLDLVTCLIDQSNQIVADSHNG